MRKPSIHIDIDTFTSIVEKLGKVNSSNVEEFFVIAKRYSLNNRSVTISNDKLKKEVTKVLQSTPGDASLMADIIYATRIKLKHRGVKRIGPDDRDWAQVKSLANVANQFCSEFELDTREGFIKYVEIGLSKIQSFRAYIAKLTNMYETICREYEAREKMNQDDNKSGTLELHDLFVNRIADRTSIYESFKDKPDKMLYFYLARVMCDELGVDYETFIDAQFASLEWCNGLPNPESLCTDRAKERLNKYLYQNNMSVQPKTKKSFWDSLKKK